MLCMIAQNLLPSFYKTYLRPVSLSFDNEVYCTRRHAFVSVGQLQCPMATTMITRTS